MQRYLIFEDEFEYEDDSDHLRLLGDAVEPPSAASMAAASALAIMAELRIQTASSTM